jgi:hypothetical protein
MHRFTPPRAHRRRVLAAAAFALLCSVAATPAAVYALQSASAHDGRGRADPEGPSVARRPAPRPALSPEDVVSIQLEALRHNDSPRRDAGIETAFQFASPANRLATGPLDRFADLVKTSSYRAMIGHRRVERGPMQVEGDEARQRVVVYSATGARVVYFFYLSRQQGGTFDGCWMTDGVSRVDDTGPRPDGLRSA